jgi:hypothetical protein
LGYSPIFKPAGGEEGEEASLTSVVVDCGWIDRRISVQFARGEVGYLEGEGVLTFIVAISVDMSDETLDDDGR